MRPIKDRYGDKLSKSQKKPKPPYWRLERMLKRLKLDFSMRGEQTPAPHIIVSDFGIVFKFSKTHILTQYEGWDVIDVSLDELEKNDIKFGENLMFHLISKGYMAYLRGDQFTTPQFKFWIVDQGWGLKIIEKRLELYNNEPRHAFMIARNTYYRDKSISYILHNHPDFFDFLW